MTGGGTRDRVRGVGLLAGMLALMVQLFAWALTMPAKPVPAMPAPVVSVSPVISVSMDEIAVCTAEGLVHRDVDGPPAGAELPVQHPDQHPDGHPAQHSEGAGCPLCPLIGGLHPPPPLHLVSQGTMTRHGPVALPGALILAGWFLSTLQARAPPV